MYSDEDLTYAAEKGIFTQASITQFRAEILKRNNTHIADEESVRLLTSFNDIFVVIACLLLLFSSAWLLSSEGYPAIAAVAVAGLSWLLAEFFVLKRKMALPAMVLLISFVGSVFWLVQALLSADMTLSSMFHADEIEISLIIATTAAALAAWLHWWRFMVPITVTAGVVSAGALIILTLLYLFPTLKQYHEILLFLSGIAIFYIALRWDGDDLNRITKKSDVAFWLHLIAAPLIIHPIFTNLNIAEGSESSVDSIIVLVLYLFLILVSLVIDRRAFMVAALVYIMAALDQIFNEYGFSSHSFSYVGICIGASLLLLAGLWHKAREVIVARLPMALQNKVPKLV